MNGFYVLIYVLAMPSVATAFIVPFRYRISYSREIYTEVFIERFRDALDLETSDVPEYQNKLMANLGKLDSKPQKEKEEENENFDFLNVVFSRVKKWIAFIGFLLSLFTILVLMVWEFLSIIYFIWDKIIKHLIL